MSDRLAVLGRALLVAKVILVLLVVDPSAADAFSLPRVAVGRATTYLLVAVLIGLIARHGTRIWRWSPLYVPAFAALAFDAAATVVAVDRPLALYGAPNRLLGLATLADLTFVMVATAFLVRTRRHAALLGIALMASSVVVLAYLAVQLAGLDPIKWTLGRTSTLGNPAHLGALCSVVASAGAAWLVFAWRDLPPLGRIGLAAVSLANALAIAPVGQRAPAIAVVAGLALIAPLFLVRGRRLAVVAGAVALVGVLGLTAVFARSDLAERFQTLISASDPARADVWSVSLSVIRERPVLGAGPDNIAAVYPAHRPPGSLTLLGPDTLETSTHNWLLQAGVGSGVPGALVALLLIVVAARQIIRLLPLEPAAVSTIAVGLTALFVNLMVAPDHYALELLLWLGLGVLAGVVPETAVPPIGQRRSARRGHTSRTLPAAGIAAMALGLGAIAALSPWPTVLASERFASAQSLSSAARHQEAVVAARSAVDLDGGRAQYWAELGNAQLATGDVRGALGSFRRAASIAPYMSGYWINVASAYLQLLDEPQRLPRAIDAGHQAVAAQPVDAGAHAILARALIQAGDRDGAISEARRSIDLYPGPDAYEVLAVAYGQSQRWADAEQAINAGFAWGDTPRFHLLLARLYLATGRKQDALGEVNHVLALDPANADAQQLRLQIGAP